MKKRALAFMLSLILLISLVPDYTYASTIKSGGSSGTITRAEWLSELTTLFDMTVEDDNYPDNYFSDLDPTSVYYYDILLAVQFGLIDVEAGEAVHPEEPVTRDFAAHTLNYCLAFQLDENVTYSFSDQDAVVYDEDAQVALNRNWVKMVDGKFSPNTILTNEEAQYMLDDAKKVWNVDPIDDNYDSTYELADGVIEVPKSEQVTIEEDGRVIFTDSSLTINIGDKFAVYKNEIPAVFSATSVTKEGNVTTIATETVAADQAFKTLDAQGVMEGDQVAVDTDSEVEVEYENDSVQPAPMQSNGVKKSSPRAKAGKGTLTLKKTVNLSLGSGLSAKATVAVNNPKVEYNFNLLKDDIYVKFSGNTEVSYTIGGGINTNFVIIPAQFAGIGGLKVYLNANVSGSATGKTCGSFSTGVSYNRQNGFRTLKWFWTDQFSITAEASASVGVEAKLGVTELPIVKAFLYAKAGGKALVKTVVYPEDGPPHRCTTCAAYVYASCGGEISISGFIDKSYRYDHTIYDMYNSPIRVYHHYEDGVEVPSCTKGKDSQCGINYFTRFYSRYWGSGWTGADNSYGLNDLGKPAPVYTYKMENGNATITGYTGSAVTLDIPKTIGGHKVTAIGEGAFKNRSGLRTVTIPDSVVEIGKMAFYQCTALSSVELPDNITTLGAWAFGECRSLGSINIPKSLETAEYYKSYTLPGEGGPFFLCSGLRKVTFEKGRIAIPAELFNNCTGLRSITIPDTVTTIGKRAFYKCSSLSNVELSENIDKLGEWSFGRCTSLASIVIPRSLVKAVYYDSYTTDGEGGPFAYCSALKNVTLETGRTIIPADLFNNCSGLEKITIPDTVTTIEESAFEYCTALSSVVIPDTLTEIQEGAFFNCTALASVKLPSYLTKLGGYAFGCCTKLTSIAIPKSLETAGYSVRTHNNEGGGGPFSLDSALKEVTFEKGRTIIPESLFNHCTGIEKITVPDTVTTIEKKAFRECTSLNSITIPNSVETIDWEAFMNCTALKSITLPDSVTSIGERIFMNDSALEKITISNQLKIIPNSMCEQCTSLKSIAIGDSVTTIRAGAFKDCSSAETVSLGKSLVTIDASAFENCSSIKKLEIPNTVTTIGEKVFSNCDALASVTMANSVSSLATGTFFDCDLLKEVNLGSGLTTIPTSMFEHCDVLESIVIPYSVRTINGKAFKDCIAFKEITLPQATTTIDAAAISYPAKTTVCGVAGTYAETFAKSLGMTFKNHEVKATEVSFAKDEFSILNGSTMLLDLNLTPKNITDVVTFRSLDEAVVAVSETGVIKAKKPGQTKVKVMVGYDLSAICTITVVQPVEKISLNETSITMNALDKKKLAASVTPYNAVNREVLWSSTNEKIATVDQQGNVTAVSKGTAIITVATKDGSNLSATCTVTVSNNAYMVDSPEAMESKHPYDNNCTDVWVYQLANAKGLDVTFDEKTEIEDFDSIYMYGAYDRQVGKYTGKELAGKTITVTGDTIKLKLDSDEQGTKWGFKVTSITPVKEKHTLTKVPEKAATCTTNGNITYWYCKDCYKYFSDSEGTKEIKYSDTVIPKTGHSYHKFIIAPTCTTKGYTKYVCGKCEHEYIDKNSYVAMTAHKYKTTVTKATINSNGSIVQKCTMCGKLLSRKTIYRPKTLTLAKTTYTYTGSPIKPSVTVKDVAGKVISSSNYTVTYAYNKAVSTAIVIVTFKNNYSGKLAKTFTILPKGTTMVSAKAGSKSFTAKWKKQAAETTGYELQYSTSSKFSKAKTIKVKKTGTVSYKVTKLSAKKTYYVRIRTYKLVNGRTYYSGWSSSKKVVTKK